ncbi:MAG: hypothetical protein NTW52_02360 [Planctomycetota bacterium]|nr:hypothetical protein [Planctomycetota bacterium]
MSDGTFPGKGEEMKIVARKHICIGIAASVLSGCFATNLIAQMPGTQFSPWNQLGRAWGIGIGDGYNECVNCPREHSKGYGINALKTSGDKVNAQYPSESAPWYSKLNPFGSNHSDSAYGVPGSNACAQSLPTSHFVLPPSGASYQHFATPAETPLPWSLAPQTHFQRSTIPQQGMHASPYASPSTTPHSGGYQADIPRAIPDPVPQQQGSGWAPQSPSSGYSTVEQYRSEPTPATRQPVPSRDKDREVIEPQRMPESTPEKPGTKKPADSPDFNRPSSSPSDDLLGTDYLLDVSDVPPPTALRSLQPQDKPLGQFPNESVPQKESPRAKETDESDSLLPMNDESFDLVPGNDLPPITQRRVMPSKQSTRAIPASVSRAWSNRIQQNTRVDEQLYSDDGHSSRQPIDGAATPWTSNPTGRSIQNRYR